MTPSFTPQTGRYQTGSFPLVVAAPDDTTFSYARKVVLSYYQAGRREERVDEDDLDAAARELAANFRRLMQGP